MRNLSLVFILIGIIFSYGYAQEYDRYYYEEGGVAAALGGAEVTPEKTIEDVLTGVVEWPEGEPTLYYDDATGLLIVTNTPDNLNVIEQIVKVQGEVPPQALIEARFIDINLDALRDIAVELPYINNLLNEDRDYNVEFGTTFGVQSEVEGAREAGSVVPFTLDVVRLTDTQFRLLMQAIEGSGESDLLSAPRVTTLNQQEARIEIVQERWLPEEESWTDYHYYSETAGRELVGLAPEDFEMAKYGTTFIVRPEISADLKTVTLDINLNITTFEGMELFGEGEDAESFRKETGRQLQTRVIVADGETIVMGGLVSESSDITVKKVPIIGDIPLVGRLFSRESKEEEKRNLLIFLTVHIISPSGEFVSEAQR